MNMMKNWKRRKTTTLICPDERRWQAWLMGEDGSAGIMQSCAEPLDAPAWAKVVLALPSREVFTLPLWIVTGDESAIEGLIRFQLERRGLRAPQGQSVVMDYRVVKRDGAQTLVLAHVLPPHFPGNLAFDSVVAYDLSARMFALPENQMVLWREHDRLVMAVSCGSELTSLQVLSDENVTAAVIMEMRSIRDVLVSERVIGSLDGITAWGGFTAEEQALLGGALRLPVIAVPKPQPRMPRELLKLMPEKAMNAREEKTGRRRKWQVAGVLAVLNLLLLGGLLAHVAFLKWQCRGMERSLAADAAEVDRVRQVAARWKSLEPATTPDSYAIEQLWRCSQCLPPEGVRLTLYEQREMREKHEARICITGESKDAPLAFKLAQDIQGSRELAAYRWTINQPKLLQNDSAQFQIEGVRTYASDQP